MFLSGDNVFRFKNELRIEMWEVGIEMWALGSEKWEVRSGKWEVGSVGMHRYA